MRRYRLSSHAKYDLKVYLVWCPKYRKRVLTGQVATRVRDLLRQVAAENELQIIPGKVAADHVHMFISYRAHQNISQPWRMTVDLKSTPLEPLALQARVVQLGSLGSPFIHQTSMTLRKTFDEAKRNAPALILLEELDALAPSRSPVTQDHKIEEITELLRLVETASENGVLVIATTNRRDAVDPAILRKGRFDHIIEVSYPTAEEVLAVVDALLNERPHREVLNLNQLAAKLAGRSLSDTAWVVNEAARLAARAKKDAIDEIDLFSAVKRLGST